MSKKILIVTVYNSENCGSFFQAYAMQKVLQGLGYEVSFFYRCPQNTSHSIFRHILSSGKALLKFRLNDAKFVWHSWLAYEKASKNFSICKLKSDEYKSIDYVLLGSDTIWNFDSNYFAKKASIYLGNIFQGKQVITYAASVANTSLEVFRKTANENGGISRISNFLVRDLYTKQIVEHETSKEVYVVTDPTLLIYKEDYLEIASKREYEEPYILIYYFGNIEENIKNEIKKYASDNKLRIVSLLKYRSWCDKSVPADPKSMITYFCHATAIITNTYHGCAFSMIFEKSFAVHNEDKKKVYDLLSKYDEQRRLFVDPEEIFTLFKEKSNIVENGKFELIRKQSLSVLENMLKTLESVS